MFCMLAARDTPPMLFGAELGPRSAKRLRYSAAAFATRFSSIERRLRSNSVPKRQHGELGSSKLSPSGGTI